MKKQIVNEGKYTKEVITLITKRGWLEIVSQLFARENKKDQWFESASSSTSLRIKGLTEFLKT